MRIADRVVGNVIVLDVTGRLTLGDDSEALVRRIEALIQGSFRRILLNLAGVPLVDSAGLGNLLHAHNLVARHGGELKLVNLTRNIKDLLAIAKLLTVFQTFESEQEAVRSYKSEEMTSRATE